MKGSTHVAGHRKSQGLSVQRSSQIDLSSLPATRGEKRRKIQCPRMNSANDGDIMPNSLNSFKVYQRRKRRVSDKAMMSMDDVYHDVARQDVINPPLDYHYDDIRRLDFSVSTI